MVERKRERQRGKKRQANTKKEKEKDKAQWREQVARRERRREKFTGKSGDVFHGKAICYPGAPFPCTVLCHMWEVNKAGTPPKNICPGL